MIALDQPTVNLLSATGGCAGLSHQSDELTCRRKRALAHRHPGGFEDKQTAFESFAFIILFAAVRSATVLAAP